MSEVDTRWEQALLNKVTSNGERIAVIERDIREIRTELSNLNGKVSNLDSRLSGLEDKTSNIDNRLSNVEQIINDVRRILMWISGGIAAILLSLIANFIYANLM